MKSKHILKLLFTISPAFLNVQLLLGQEQNPNETYAIKVSQSVFKQKQVVPPSPEASGLGRYGNVPVSFYTGTPNISVPLYNLPSSKINLPITLSYNAQGLRPQDIASWVGQGWNLNAGGVVTRSVIGNPDTDLNYFNKTPISNPPSTANMFDYYDLMKEMVKTNREDQSDVYYYNFGSISGKMFLTRAGEPVKKSKDNLKISNSFGDLFYMVDEQGNQYSFSVNEITYLTTIDPVELPTDEFSPTIRGYTFASACYLSSVYSADGTERVEFEYFNGGTHTMQNHHLQSQMVTYSTKTYDATYSLCNQVSGALEPIIKTSTGPLTQIERKYLKKISYYKNNVLVAYVDFISQADLRLDLNDSFFGGERLLQGIKIYNRDVNGNNFKLDKEYEFNYGYFNTNERLRLESVIEKPADISTPIKPAYSFTYNPLSGSNNLTAIDHWGFYNGATNTSMIPNVQVSPNVTRGLGANRNPSFEASSAGILSKITYPTGGYTEFVYEGHNALDENGAYMLVGGVRIKEITDYSFNTNKAVTKKYFYTDEKGITTGKAQRPNYFANGTTYLKEPENCGCNQSDGCQQCCEKWASYSISGITMHASAISGLGTIQGSHIVYKKVTEKQIDVITGNDLGKTEYEFMFTNFNERDDDVFNGSLLKQSTYNNGEKLLSEITNEYSGVPVNTPAIVNWYPEVATTQDNLSKLCKITENGTTYYTWRKIIENEAPICNDYRIYKTKYNLNGYVISPQSKVLVKQIQKSYDQARDAYITSTNEFIYGNNSYVLPTKIIQTTTNGEQFVTEKKYPLDYDATNPQDAASQAIFGLQSANVIGAEIETVQYRQNSNGTNKRFVSGQITQYNALQPVQFYGLSLTQPITSYSMSTVNNGNFSYNPNYRLLGNMSYSNGNLITQSKANDVITAYIWDYNQSLPTAQIVNADNGTVAYSSFETDQTGMWTTIPNIGTSRVSGSITGNFAYQLTAGNNITKTSLPASRRYVVTYWSKNGTVNISTNSGVASATAGSTYNTWTYYSHLLPANSVSVTLSSNSNVIIDELRLYPADAQMTTMAYDEHNGEMISQCNPSNQISYFEYDGYSRLINVKDINGHIVKNYQYNYGTNTTALNPSSQTLFYNNYTEQIFYKQGCPSGSEAQPFVYKVPYGKYASAINQSDANAKAQADIAANGQATANAKGVCYFWNTEQRLRFFKNNCQPWEGSGLAYWYIVPARTYFSLISIADANAKAQADITANGQNAANNFGSCSCTQQGYRFVNGQCEAGQISYAGYVYEPNCAPGMNYRCFYFYYFSDGSQSPMYEMCSATPCQQL